jgi:hypothetical protein
MRNEPETMLESDDVKAVRYRPTDGKGYLWDVIVTFEDGRTLTIGCEGAVHARQLWAAMNSAAHMTIDDPSPDFMSQALNEGAGVYRP